MAKKSVIDEKDLNEEETTRQDKWRIVNWLFFVAAILVLIGGTFVLRPLDFFVTDKDNINVPTWDLLWFVVVLFVLHELVYWAIPKSIENANVTYSHVELTVIWKMISGLVSMIALLITVNATADILSSIGIVIVGVPAVTLIVYAYVKLNELKWM